MDDPQHGADEPSATRVWAARVLYAALLVAGAAGLTRVPGRDQVTHHVVLTAGLAALSVAGYLATDRLHRRLGRVFDMSLAVSLVGLAVAGPLAAVLITTAPDVIHLARRRRAFCNLGLVANVVSWIAVALVGAAIVGPAHGSDLAARAARLLAAGVMMTATNYLFARLLPAVIRERRPAGRLVRSEFVALAPLELAAVASGALCALLIDPLGVFAIVALSVSAYVAQLAAVALLRAPSVAALTVDAAAAVYRDALADELRLSRGDRRLSHSVDALVQRRPLPGAPEHAAAAMQDALLVRICTERAPTQRHFSATPRSQVVLVARRWAQLTARCTPALNHHEALLELHRSGLGRDAPLALRAAERIVAREHALTEHVAGVPRLHRAPLPRTLRHDVLPGALVRLGA